MHVLSASVRIPKFLSIHNFYTWNVNQASGFVHANSGCLRFLSKADIKKKSKNKTFVSCLLRLQANFLGGWEGVSSCKMVNLVKIRYVFIYIKKSLGEVNFLQSSNAIFMFS